MPGSCRSRISEVVAARAQPLEGLPAVAERLDLEALGLR